jgi:hypothetical protein
MRNLPTTMIKSKSKSQTYFVTATIEVVYEVFAKSKDEAESKFWEAIDDCGVRYDLAENCGGSSVTDIIKIEDAHEHLGPAE